MSSFGVPRSFSSTCLSSGGRGGIAIASGGIGSGSTVVNIADDRHAFLLIKKFACQYWNYTVSPSYGTLFITPRFVLFEYGGKKTLSGSDTNSSSSSSTTILSGGGIVGHNTGGNNGGGGRGGYIEEEDVYTQLPEHRELKINSNCIIIPFQDIQLASKTTYLFKSVLLIQTNLSSYYFIGLKSITNACSVINHVLDQLKLYGSKPRSVSKKRKERAIELKVDENGFLKEIQYGEDSSEEEEEIEFENRLIYSARGKKLDPFSYIKSLTPSNFTSKKTMEEEEFARQQSNRSLQINTPVQNNNITTAEATATASTASSFNYYLSGLYSYSVGPLVNMFSTIEKKETTPSFMDHSSLEVLIKDDRWYKKYMILDETGFSITSNKNKTELFVPYKQLTDVHTVNTFICNLSYQESENHESKHIKMISLYLPIILNLFLQENQTILFLDEKISTTIQLDSELANQLNQSGTADIEEILNQESPEEINLPINL